MFDYISRYVPPVPEEIEKDKLSELMVRGGVKLMDI
jgi:hypothetical protein